MLNICSIINDLVHFIIHVQGMIMLNTCSMLQTDSFQAMLHAEKTFSPGWPPVPTPRWREACWDTTYGQIYICIYVWTSSFSHPLFPHILLLPLYMGDFTRGGEWLLKNVTFFSYSETNISLKINIDTKQPTCMYQLRFRRGPHDLFWRHSLVELV